MNISKFLSRGGLVAGAFLCGQFFSNAQAGSSGGGVSNASFSRIPLTFTLDSRLGYDDNTLDEPDRVDLVVGGTRRNVTSRKPSDSIFVNEQLSLAYGAGNSRSNLTLGATAGITYYFDRPGREYDLNFGLSVRYQYKLTPRATFNASSFNVYQSEPDFGLVSGQTRRSGDYFYSSNELSLAYRWAPRFSTVSAYDPVFFVYRQEPYSTFQDRTEQYFRQEFRFLLSPTISLVAEYRFGYISYFDIDNDSYSHFLLGGFDMALSPRLRTSLRVGAELRTYTDTSVRAAAQPAFVLQPNGFFAAVAVPVQTVGEGHAYSPYVEGSLFYDLSRRSNVSLTLRYGLEEGDTTLANSFRETFRIGVAWNQALTARISGYLSMFYQHSNYDNGDTIDLFGRRFGNDYDEDVLDVAVGLRYAINRHFSAELGYSHTLARSDYRTPFGANGYLEGQRDYDRNRVFGGIRVSF